MARRIEMQDTIAFYEFQPLEHLIKQTTIQHLMQISHVHLAQDYVHIEVITTKMQRAPNGAGSGS